VAFKIKGEGVDGVYTIEYITSMNCAFGFHGSLSFYVCITTKIALFEVLRMDLCLIL